MFDLIAVVIKRNEREEETNKNKEKIQQRWEKNYSKRSKNGLQNVVWALKDSWHQSQTSALVRWKFVLFHHSYFFSFSFSSFNSTTLCCTCNVILYFYFHIFILYVVYMKVSISEDVINIRFSLCAQWRTFSCFWQMIFFVKFILWWRLNVVFLWLF